MIDWASQQAPITPQNPLNVYQTNSWLASIGTYNIAVGQGVFVDITASMAPGPQQNFMSGEMWPCYRTQSGGSSIQFGVSLIAQGYGAVPMSTSGTLTFASSGTYEFGLCGGPISPDVPVSVVRAGGSLVIFNAP